MRLLIGSALGVGMFFRVLGPLTIEDGGVAAQIKGVKPRLLLAALLVEANRPVSADRLVDVLWAHQPPANYGPALHNHVLRIRRLLGDTDLSRLRTTVSGYQLHVRPEEFDLDQFTASSRLGQHAYHQQDWAGASAHLATALSWWHGEPLADLPMALPLRIVTASWAEQYLHAVETRIDADLRLGRHHAVVPEITALLATHPLRERLHLLAMLAHHRAGRQADALAAYRHARDVLVAELGVEPGPELRHLHATILAGDLHGEPALVFARSAQVRRPAQLPADVSDFAGRGSEVRQLADLLTDAGPAGHRRVPPVAAIIGGAGTGKTSLAVHVAHHIAGDFPDGQLYADLHSGDPDARPPGSVLAAFLAALGPVDDHVPADEPAMAARFRGLLAGRRVLVVLDNARDAAQVRPLLPDTGGCAVIITSRDRLTGLDGCHRVDLARQVDRPDWRAGTPAQIPPGVSPFVGRADQLRDLSRYLLGPERAATPLALITGTGGCGKTELAVRWARQAVESFPDGQLYLDLQGYSHLRPLSPLGALGSLLRALGVPGDRIPGAQPDAAGLFRSVTAGRRLLLLLDNARSAEDVRPLIPGDPGSAVLVTSRDRLDGLVARNGARRVPVDVLAEHDAVTLLTQILGSAYPGPELRRLARACACLPLALRIAAAHLDGESPAFLAGYVELLETGAWSRALGIDGDENSSVHAAFQLSYDALGNQEQELFRLLGLVPGPDFTVAAVAALADIPADDARQRLDRLATAHLVGRGSDDRYSFHDLLQAYAAELATAAGPVSEPRRRLAAWYLESVRDATRPRYPDALRLPDEPTAGAVISGGAGDWLDREHHNIIAVIDQAAAGADSDLAWRLAFAYRPHLFARSDARPLHDTGVTALAAAHDDPVGAAAARLILAHAAEKLGTLAESAEHMRAAVLLCDQAGWAAGRASALNGLGVVGMQNGRTGEAVAAFERNIAAMCDIGDRQGAALARMNLGLLIAMCGRLREGVGQLRRAADFYLEFGPAAKLTPALAFLGITYRELGEFAQAEQSLTDAISTGERTGDPYFACVAEGTLAGVWCDRGDFVRASEHLDRADELVERTGLVKLAASTAMHRGWFELVRERAGGARPWYERVLSYGESAGDPWYRARGLIGLSACLRADKESVASVRAAAGALHSTRRCGYRVPVAQALLELAQTHSEFGDPDRALAHAHDAARIARECDHWATTHTAAHVIARLENST